MKQTNRTLSRRSFLGTSLAAGAAVNIGSSALNSPFHGVLGANDRVNVGFIGVGNRGSQLLDSFLKCPDVDVTALCDVYEPYLYRDRARVEDSQLKELGGRIPEMEEGLPKSVRRYKDFRQLLDQKDIDAVVIATPDHWHAIQAIAACQSGKDVYVEKPLSITIKEGRRMVQVAQETGRVVQVGLQRRSSVVYSPLPSVVQGGRIGKVSVARAYRVSNMYPIGIGKAKTGDPPPTLDWDAWLGPRTWRDYQANIHPYRFRWWHEYSSQVGNWGVHYFDAIRWVIGEEAPISISAHGGKYVVDDDRTIPDTLEVTFEFASGRLLVFGQYEGSGGRPISGGEIELQGTKGTLLSNPAYSQSAGYKIVPSGRGQFQKPGALIEPEEQGIESQDPTDAHVRDFLDRVKDRKPCNCPMETGHRSTTFAHLANIALATRTRLEWDPKSERITNSEEANQHLHYAYRKPWKLG